MKSVRKAAVAAVLCIAAIAAVKAQKADVTVTVKGIKEAKGRMMIAAVNSADPQQKAYDMAEVKAVGSLTSVLKEVLEGVYTFYVFQDLNDNYTLDKDDEGTPIEPCGTREKVRVEASGTVVEVKVYDVKAMQGK